MQTSFDKFPMAGIAALAALVLGAAVTFRPSRIPGFVSDGNPRLNRVDVSTKAALRSSPGPAVAKAFDEKSQQEFQSLEDLAFRDPGAALSNLAAVVDPDLRGLALAAVARGWAGNDSQAAAAWVAALEVEEDGVSAALGLVPVWVREDPNDCLAWATGLEVGNLREVSLTQLADAWVAVDPRNALSRFFSLQPEPGSEGGLHVIVARWALDDPRAALEYLTSLHENPRREEFLETALVSLSNQNPQQAWNDAERISDAERIRNVRSMALESMAEAEPLAALKLAESAGNDPVFLEGIARGWASWDAAAAKAWIGNITDRELAESLLVEISGE